MDSAERTEIRQMMADWHWERRQLEESAAFYEGEANRPQSNPEYARWCRANARRLREAAASCDEA